MKLRLIVVTCAMTAAGCSSSTPQDACDRLHLDLDEVEVDMGAIVAQSWDDIQKLQQLQVRRDEIWMALASNGCHGADGP